MTLTLATIVPKNQQTAKRAKTAKTSLGELRVLGGPFVGFKGGIRQSCAIRGPDVDVPA